MGYEFTLAFRHLDFDDETLEQLDRVMPKADWTKREGQVQADVSGVDALDAVDAALRTEKAVRTVVPAARATHVVEDFVAIPDIAERVGVDREAVRHWVKGTRGAGSFPRPRSVVGDRVKIWDWPSVNEWLGRQGRGVGRNTLFSSRDVARVNHALAALPAERAIGVEIAPERVFGVVTDDTGRVYDDGSKDIPRPGTPEQAVEQVAALLQEFRAEHAQVPPAFLGVHVGGHVDHQGKVVLAPRYQRGAGWKDTDLSRLLESATNLPTVVQNDANALALYERYLGVGQDARTFVVVLLRVGVGAGIVSDGELVTGSDGAAGEIGHLVVARGFQCTCGNDDCLECVVGVENLIRAVGEATQKSVASLEEALKLAEDTDEAQDKVAGAGEALGRAMSMVLNLFNPSNLVLYAPSVLLRETGKSRFMVEMTNARTRYSFSTNKRCKIVPRPQEADDQRSAIGAALGALRAQR
jgi:predicted NBD/HSP70 family sugar kinase